MSDQRTLNYPRPDPFDPLAPEADLVQEYIPQAPPPPGPPGTTRVEPLRRQMQPQYFETSPVNGLFGLGPSFVVKLELGAYCQNVTITNQTPSGAPADILIFAFGATPIAGATGGRLFTGESVSFKNLSLPNPTLFLSAVNGAGAPSTGCYVRIWYW